MVFIASNHPVWRVVRRSLQLLTGAAMLTAVLGAGPIDTTPAAAIEPLATVSVAVNPAPEKLESTAIHAEPAEGPVRLARVEQPAPLPLTSISFLSGRIASAALGERAPPRL